MECPQTTCDNAGSLLSLKLPWLILRVDSLIWVWPKVDRIRDNCPDPSICSGLTKCLWLRPLKRWGISLFLCCWKAIDGRTRFERDKTTLKKTTTSRADRGISRKTAAERGYKKSKMVTISFCHCLIMFMLEVFFFSLSEKKNVEGCGTIRKMRINK